MITAKGTFDDMRQGFLSGSDDYMVKPVNVNEMVLRVGALLRRAQILSEHKIVIGSTEFDYDQMTVKIGSEIQVLPKKEFLLLYKLAASPGRTMSGEWKQRLIHIRLKFILEELESDLRKTLILKLSLCEGLDIRW